MTARDDRNAKREKARERADKAERKDSRTRALIESYDSKSRPTMPESRNDQRLHRQGLAARGESLARFSATNRGVVMKPSDMSGTDGKARRVMKENGASV